MIMGITGTRNGMTQAQNNAFVGLVVQLKPRRLLHGRCCGADVQAARIAKLHGVPTVGYPGPPDDGFTVLDWVDDEVKPPKTHFARNRDIVNASDCLVAFPLGMTLSERGGTSYTVQFCRKQKKRLIIIWPDGTVAVEGTPHASNP